ncbi:hypothetical protein PISMIDRAFT_676155 [Pisolithus microcarpus 441]|uniref:Uncharacterized protein n=1 Tax=Pisolithus microcarpus 441 TaxID=765257 RepID=A0A0C9ZAM1_9AGAM|nr:hypothetical protein PISMIDRAFT_676155 [Pisolithus microcarpus 441]
MRRGNKAIVTIYEEVLKEKIVVHSPPPIVPGRDFVPFVVVQYPLEPEEARCNNDVLPHQFH